MRRLLLLALLAGCAGGPAPSRAPRPAPAAVALPAASGPAPAPRRVVVTTTEIEVLEPIEFVADSTAITEASLPMLDTMVAILLGNDSLRLVEVGVSIGDGVVADRDERARLAADRASVIVEALVARGVARERLVPVGTIDGPSSTSLSILDRAP